MHSSSSWSLATLLMLLLSACVADPVITPTPDNAAPSHGVVIVNEGLWFQDNSSLSLYDPIAGTSVNDWFAVRNPGQRIGDTGNDIVVRNGTAFVVVTTSQNVEAIELPSGRTLGRVRIGTGDPRKLTIVNDSIAYVTLVKSDAVIRFDPRSRAAGTRVSVGPAPEGIASVGGRVFIANSGYGLLRRNEAKAGTVSVLDATSAGELASLSPGSNPVAVRADTVRGIVFVQFGMPHADSAGGVVAYDASTLREMQRWSVTGSGVAGELAYDDARRLLYVIDGAGTIVRIDAASTELPKRFATQSSPSALGFYGVGVSPGDGLVYASIVTSYSLPGTVVIYDRDGAEKDRFEAGLNPATFGFF